MASKAQKKPAQKKRTAVRTKNAVKTTSSAAVPAAPANENVLTLAEQTRIGQALELKNSLARLLEGGDHICIDASSVKKIDTSGLQLLTAFSLRAQRSNIEIEWLSPSQEFVDAAELLGVGHYIWGKKKIVTHARCATQ